MNEEPLQDVPAAAAPIETPPPAPPEPPLSLDEVVRGLVFARRGTGPRLPAERVGSAVTSSDLAYQVQGRVSAAFWPDAQPAVWKAGADSRESLPTAAPIMPALVVENGGTLVSSTFQSRIVEAEIAYRFGKDLPPRGTPYGIEEVNDAVESMHVAIEVVDSRMTDFLTGSAWAKLADHGLNGAFVLGDGVKDWKRIDLRKQKATLSFDGKLHEAVEGTHSLGNPAVLLPWFVAHLGRLPTFDSDGKRGEPRGVKAGDVLTTGSWTRIAEPRPRQRVDVVFPEIGAVSVTFVA